MPIDSKHPKYNDYASRWSLVRDIVRNDAKKRIRMVDENDLKRSKQYREDAILTNFTKLTRDGLAGLVMRRPPKKNLPVELDYVEDDATGENLGLDQLSFSLICELLETGRVGLLVDYPQVTPDLSEADKANNSFLARIKPYCAESIINHNCAQIGSKCIPVLIVLQEDRQELGDDGYEWKPVTYFRKLYLNAAGYYTQEVYKQYDSVDVLVEGPYTPLDKDGNPWKEIPFYFIGSSKNSPDYDDIPLYDLSVISLGHYRNSADVEEASFICGQPFPVVQLGETSEELFRAANPNGICFGSRSGLTLGSGGDVKLLQAGANLLPMQLMKEKEAQAAAIGARLISPPGGRQTAEEARIRYGAQNSSLHILTYNISEALEHVLGWMCKYQGGDASIIEYDLNDQFYEDSADPNLIVQQIMLHDRKLMPAEDIVKYGQKTGFIDDMSTPAEVLALAAKNEVPQAPAPDAASGPSEAGFKQ